jgi:hypothetical protein
MPGILVQTQIFKHIVNVVDYLSFLVQVIHGNSVAMTSCQGCILVEDNPRRANEVKLSFMYGQDGLHSVLNYLIATGRSFHRSPIEALGGLLTA